MKEPGADSSEQHLHSGQKQTAPLMPRSYLTQDKLLSPLFNRDTLEMSLCYQGSCSAISRGCGCATEEPSRHLLCLTLRKHRAGFKKGAEDVMEPLMCLGFSSGIQFYQETKVLVGLSAERNPGPVWLGEGPWGLLCQGASSQQNQQHWAPPTNYVEFCKIFSTVKGLPGADSSEKGRRSHKHAEITRRTSKIKCYLQVAH